jgi:hypothetical protein
MHEKHEHKHVLFVPFVFFVDNAFVADSLL